MNKKKLALLLLCLPLTAFGWEVEESFNVDTGGTLRLKADVGSVDITTHDSDTVDFLMEVRGYDEDDLVVDFDHGGDDLTVDVDRRRKWGSDWGNNRRVSFTITVPGTYNVDISTSGGAISVLDLIGEVDLVTSGGSISLDRVVGEVDGRTSGGSITIDDVDGMARLRTSGGTIRVTEITGDVRAETSGGSIRIRRAGGDIVANTSGGGISIADATAGVDASTSGGSIDLEIAQQPSADAELSTSGGSITVELANGIGMDLDARANRIRSDFPVNGVRTAKKSLRGELNGGGPTLEITASGGTINIKDD